MKIRLGTRLAGEVCECLSSLLPDKARQIEMIAERAKKHGLDVEIKSITPRRSLDQNARYWLIVGALADHVGMTKNEMHEECLSEYHGFDLVEFRGSIHKRPKGRSHNLSREDFSALMAIAEKWCAESGVYFDECG